MSDPRLTMSTDLQVFAGDNGKRAECPIQVSQYSDENEIPWCSVRMGGYSGKVVCILSNDPAFLRDLAGKCASAAFELEARQKEQRELEAARLKRATDATPDIALEIKDAPGPI